VGFWDKRGRETEPNKAGFCNSREKGKKHPPKTAIMERVRTVEERQIGEKDAELRARSLNSPRSYDPRAEKTGKGTHGPSVKGQTIKGGTQSAKVFF